MKTDAVKAHGIHYTPPELADFLAAKTILQLGVVDGEFDVLDPACGDGALLRSFAVGLPPHLRRRCRLFGYDTNPIAVRHAQEVLSNVEVAAVCITPCDFLEVVDLHDPQRGLFDSPDLEKPQKYRAIIANPPYVRTQVLGAAKAQSLATKFGLSGRVDLYHAFIKAMSVALVPGGTLGLLTSNRFLTIKSGATTRQLLAADFVLREIIDLGDTKLFSAAVLPVIVTGVKRPLSPLQLCEQETSCLFSRVYEDRASVGGDGLAKKVETVLDALGTGGSAGLVRTDKGVYRVERGSLLDAGHESAWSLTTPGYERWLAGVRKKQAYTFGDVAQIRVGIKTTADEVFLKEDWSALPADCQPEQELLRPLIRHYDAARWVSAGYSQSVLYPHETKRGQRVPVDLKCYPKAEQYLKQNYARLVGRKYVIEGGRKWYEIWVPHSPEEWPKPKLVYPDIAEEPRFFLDRSGAVVNGDCYWITLNEGVSADVLLLMLGVANSTLVTRFYDIAFHNKLYSGRRRYMTQYVKQFPLPDPATKASRKVVSLVSDVVNNGSAGPEQEREIDAHVWAAFGLVKES
jgi:adenine-specific DNA-methyltransferase